MIIEVWSDYVCPFCYINQKKLYDAIDKLALEKKITVKYRSYELDPRKVRDKTLNVVETLAQNYNIEPLAKAEHIMNKTAKKVKDAGLDYNMKDVIGANTYDAHRLAYYANEKGKTKEFTDNMFKAHHVKGLDIEKAEVLLSIIKASGLDEVQAKYILESGKYDENIKQDYKKAKKLKINLVPTLISDSGNRIEGELESEQYEEFLKSLGL